MGKYPNSDIHKLYSDWHWGLVEKDDKYKKLYVSDLDRLWVEYDFASEEIIAVVDIKWENSGDTMTPTEIGVRNWLERHGAKFYIVYITRSFNRFRIVNSAGFESIKTSLDYADWLLSLRNGIDDEGFHKHLETVWEDEPTQPSGIHWPGWGEGYHPTWPKATLEQWVIKGTGTKAQIERYKKDIAWYNENT